ncbi:hypothetical protein DPMN_029934 [Dreissena polymorpha]|uniref:DUF4371 domain-containing protein n=1 Tax=Dreissena polymorpha TaxID=45954 RepID=A0A9D4LZF8_DREPO|nr:hypothetical protein DPMN_029934 [Dreissena polymorpha]
MHTSRISTVIQNKVLTKPFHVLSSNLSKDVQAARYFGIICDESTDLSIHKKLFVYIRYVNQSTQEVEHKLMGNIRIPDGTVATIATEILREL